MTTPPPRPLRADARRNRDLIVEAARTAFASKGVDAPLEEIAKTVGVGQGTLYRHFPTREDLIAAAIQDDVDQLVRNSDKYAHGRDPLMALGKSGSFSVVCGSLESLTDRILVRAKEADQIRANVTPEDVFLLANAIAWSLTKTPGTELLDKHIDILLRGIASGTGAAS